MDEFRLVDDGRSDNITPEAHIKKCYLCQCGKAFKTQKELNDHIFEEEYD